MTQVFHIGSYAIKARMACVLVVGIVLGAALTANISLAADGSDSRPYDDKLLRLSEVLGAIHYLRELCGANEGQLWRDRMRELITTDNGSALRKVKLTKSFNQGYRSYRRTYQICNAPAQTALTRFLSEGAELSESLFRDTP